MTIVTANFIRSVSDRVNPGDRIDTTSILYLQTLIQPYEQVLAAATDVDSIYNWISVAIPGEMGDTAAAEMISSVVNALVDESNIGDFDTTNLFGYFICFVFVFIRVNHR